MEVYIDLLILLNFLVDLLLILGANRLCGHRPGVKRALGAAALGGLYAGACVLPGFQFLSGTLWRLICLCLVGVAAFGCSQSGLRRGCLFVVLSMALGGIALGLRQGGFFSLLLSAGVLSLLCLVGFRGRAGGQEFVPVTIRHGAQSLSLTALLDTGNTLTDPISGRPVLVVDARAAQRLLGLGPEELARPLETMAAGKGLGLRLIPYSAVGQHGGMLLAIRPDGLRLDGREADYMVAFAPQMLGQGQFQALAGGVL